MSDVLKEYWHLIVGALGFTAWLVRLEATTKSSAKAQAAALESHKNLIDVKLQAQNTVHSEQLTRIEAMQSEIREDIKKLMMGGHSRT